MDKEISKIVSTDICDKEDNTQYKFSDYTESRIEYLFNKYIDEVKSEKSTIEEYEHEISEEIISEYDFSRRGFISGENWEKTVNIHSRILKSTKEFVTCECVIDKENKIFQTRSFPSYLFSHLDPLESKKPVLIKIRTKAGSSRIDIYDGKNIVDINLFDLEDKWNLLKDSKLDNPLTL